MHIAVITEYNPFHMGHKYQLCEVRRAYPNACITAIMGGIFSQRGEPYIASPYTRGEAAVLCGADLVLELPFPFSSAPASVFARAGVEIAAKIGADILAFGSECGDIDTLKTMLSRLDSDKMRDAVKNESPSIGKTRAYANAYKRLYGEECADLPNDILAIEYLRAIKRGGYDITPFTIKRIGSFKGGNDGFASATSLRHDFDAFGADALSGKVPTAAEELYRREFFGSDIENLASAAILKLYECGEDIAFSSDGLLNHIKAASLTAQSIKEVQKAAATKRYTDAEISRCILYSLLNITRADMEKEVLYTRLFAANARGREILNQLSKIEIVTKPSATEKLSAAARAQYEKTFLAERAFALCLNEKYEFTKQMPRIK